MKSRLAFFASAILTITYAHAVDLTWNDGDSTGNWNTSDANWTGSIWDSSTSDNAIFDATGIGTVTLTESITVGNITFNNAGYTIASDTLNLSGSTIHTAADATISSVLDGTTGMTKSGSGMLSLTGVSTYSGGTTINDGTLSLESTTSDVAVNGTVTVNSSGILRIAGADWAGFGANSGRKIDLLNIVDGTVTNTLNTSFITDATINMTAGTISGGDINWRNSALNSLASASIATVSSKILIRNDYAPGVNLTIDTENGGNPATDLLVSGVIAQADNSGNFPGLVKSGDGTLELTNISSFTGGTTVNGGNLLLNLTTSAISAIRGTVTVNSGATLTVSGAAFGGFGTDPGTRIETLNVAGGSVVVVDQKMSSGSTFNLTGGSISGGTIHWRDTAIQSLASATTSTISSELLIRPDYGTPTLSIDVANGAAATDLLVSGLIKESSPSGNLFKSGAGNLELTASNSYSGTTNVSGGTLTITGFSNSSQVTVASSATLAGNGSIQGNVTISSGGHHALAVAAEDYLQVPRQIYGTLTLEAGTFLDLTAAEAPAPGIYLLLTAAGGITGPLPTVTGIVGTVSIIDDNNLELTVTETPYSTWAQAKITDIDPLANATPTGDPDGDGVANSAEFALNGNPLDGSKNGYDLGQTVNVPAVGDALILTFASRTGADFGVGNTASIDGVNYTVQGSLDLTSFTAPVTKVSPAIVPPGWPAPDSSYAYHTFRLNASTGLTGKGFLRVKTEQAP